MREFDLNIERVLENWTVAHALREVIANALDEQALTGTRDPQIFRDAQPASSFRFLVIDDPVQAMDPAKVDGLARVLESTAVGRQVIVFTHDNRLAQAVRAPPHCLPDRPSKQPWPKYGRPSRRQPKCPAAPRDRSSCA